MGAIAKSQYAELLRTLAPLLGRDVWMRAVVTSALMLVSALAELVTIGSVFPFLILLTGGDDHWSGRFLQNLAATQGANSEQLVIIAASILSGAAIASGLLRLATTLATQNLVVRVAHSVGCALFSRILRQPYSAHLRRDPSLVYSAVEKIQAATHELLSPLLNAIVATVMVVSVLGLLLFLAPWQALAGGAGLIGLYAVIAWRSRRLLSRSSALLAQARTARMALLQEAIGGIRDILLTRCQGEIEGRYRATNRQLMNAQISSLAVQAWPRYAFEAGGIALLAAFAVFLSASSGGLETTLPLLGLIALSAQRLLPQVQTIYAAFASGLSSVQSLFDVLEILNEPLAPLPPNLDTHGARFESIEFKRIGFSYPDRPAALVNIDLVIQKGERIALMGPTGSGKSTLVDLMTGMLLPSSGEIRINGREFSGTDLAAWQAQLAVVPQDPYLVGRSIAENIAFGTPRQDIDQSRVVRAAEQAHVHDFIQSLPEGYDTVVGERGIALSGGQRQRIAIARAFFREVRVLILDEATSALDQRTEAGILTTMEELPQDVTLIRITHRPETVAEDYRTVYLNSGRIVRDTRAGSGATR